MGEKTSLVAFSFDETFRKNSLSFAMADLPSSHVLRIMLLCMVAGVICLVAGSLGGLQKLPRELGRGAKIRRSVACLCMLADILLTPVFVLLNNYTFWRRIRLYSEDLITEGKDAFFAKVDRFLFGGAMGENIDAALKNLSADHSRLIWLLILCFLLAAVAAVQIRFGAIKKTVLRALLYLFVIVVCVVTLYPYYVMFVTAFPSKAETLDMYFLHMIPTKWIWSNLRTLSTEACPASCSTP